MEQKMKNVSKKEIAYEIGKDIVDTGKRTGKGLAKIVCAATYPIAGNLSYNIQDKLEKLLGKEYYDSEKAYGVSLKTNVAIYSLASTTFIAYKNGKDLSSETCSSFCQDLNAAGAVIFGLGLGALIGTGEYLGRKEVEKENHSLQISASLIGKIVSAPIDAIFFCYNKFDRYLKDVKCRLKSRRT